MQLHLLVPPVRPKPRALPQTGAEIKMPGENGGSVWVPHPGTGPAEERWVTFLSLPLQSAADAVTPCPEGAETLSGGRRMLSRQQRSSHFLLMLPVPRAKPYHHPLLRSYGVTRCECSALFHFQSACIIIGFFFTKDLKYSHARAPSPCLAKTSA